MIDEKATLKALVRALLKEVREQERRRPQPAWVVQSDLMRIFHAFRDHPLRCEDGGTTVLVGGTGWQPPMEIRLLPQKPLAEREAEQEAEWRKLFE